MTIYVAAPPDYFKLLAQIGGERFMELLRLDISEDRREYVHWDKLRQLQPPPTLSSEEWWFLIKTSRRRVERQIPLADPDWERFTYSTPDLVARRLHYVDQHCAGEVAMPEVVTADGQARQHYLVNSLMEEAIRSSQLEGATTTRSVAKELLADGAGAKESKRAHDRQQLQGASIHARWHAR